MYNSIFIGLIMTITRSVQKMYKNSLTYRIFSTVERYIRIIYRGSLFHSFNKSSEGIFKNSFIYKGVRCIFKILDNILDFLRGLIKKIGFNSEISKGLDYYSSSMASALRLFYETFVLLGIILIIGNFLGYKGIPILFNLLLIGLGLFGIHLNGLELTAIEESAFINFFLDLFKEDKGGENWW
ncbi:MAG: hypothetical protein GXY89_02700 [Tissierellia bacterium]|nr:hypothetical protein [Tissierellia bacterium]